MNHTIDLAETANATIRELILDTRGDHALTEPAELARLLTTLTALTGGLPQLLGQLQRWLHHHHAQGRLHATDGHHTDDHVDAATTRLTQARQAATMLTTALDTAHQHTAALAASPPNTHETKQHQGVSFHP